MNRSFLEHGLGVLILVGLTAAGWWGAILPYLSRAASEAQAVAELSQSRLTAAEVARQLSTVQNQLRTARLELDTYNQPCWNQHERSHRIESIYQLARDSGVQVEAVEPSDTERVGGRRTLPMRLSAKGEFASLVRLFAELRRSQPDVVLRSLDMVTAPSSEGQLLVNSELLWVPTSPANPTPGQPNPNAPAEASVR
jgi:Tfp pilus assembly protein PilO